VQACNRNLVVNWRSPSTCSQPPPLASRRRKRGAAERGSSSAAVNDLASSPKFDRWRRKLFAFTSRLFCARTIKEKKEYNNPPPPPSLPWFIKSPCCRPPSTPSFHSFRRRSLASFNARRYWFGTSSPLIPVGVGSTALILMGGLKVCPTHVSRSPSLISSRMRSRLPTASVGRASCSCGRAWWRKE
jgi:hypothetical protein